MGDVMLDIVKDGGVAAALLVMVVLFLRAAKDMRDEGYTRTELLQNHFTESLDRLMEAQMERTRMIVQTHDKAMVQITKTLEKVERAMDSYCRYPGVVEKRK